MVYHQNRQQAELFAIWPTRLMLGNPDDREVAKESYNRRNFQHIFNGWDLDIAHAAALGLLDEVETWFDKHFDRTYTLPCGLAKEDGPGNPATTAAEWRPYCIPSWIPECPSLQGMGTGVLPVLEMLLQDYPDKLVVLPCWPADVPVSFALYSPYAGRVEVSYRPGQELGVKTERPLPVESPLRKNVLAIVNP